MTAIFAGATNFNQPLDNWNLSNVTDINTTFIDAPNFNQYINKDVISN